MSDPPRWRLAADLWNQCHNHIAEVAGDLTERVYTEDLIEHENKYTYRQSKAATFVDEQLAAYAKANMIEP